MVPFLWDAFSTHPYPTSPSPSHSCKVLLEIHLLQISFLNFLFPAPLLRNNSSESPKHLIWTLLMHTHTHTQNYTMEYYSAIKNESMPSAPTWMELEIIILSEVTQRKRNIIWYHLYIEYKKLYKWIYLQNKETHRCLKQTYGYQKRQQWGSKLGLWISVYSFLYIKYMQIFHSDPELTHPIFRAGEGNLLLHYDFWSHANDSLIQQRTVGCTRAQFDRGIFSSLSQ